MSRQRQVWGRLVVAAVGTLSVVVCVAASSATNAGGTPPSARTSVSRSPTPLRRIIAGLRALGFTLATVTDITGPTTAGSVYPRH